MSAGNYCFWRPVFKVCLARFYIHLSDHGVRSSDAEITAMIGPALWLRLIRFDSRCFRKPIDGAHIIAESCRSRFSDWDGIVTVAVFCQRRKDGLAGIGRISVATNPGLLRHRPTLALATMDRPSSRTLAQSHLTLSIHHVLHFHPAAGSYSLAIRIACVLRSQPVPISTFGTQFRRHQVLGRRHCYHGR
jgi:hypothetical protein